jgi:hypothetical protein
VAVYIAHRISRLEDVFALPLKERDQAALGP